MKKYLFGLLILIFIQFFCTKAISMLNIKFPAPILGIIVMALLLEFKIIKKEWVKDISNLLLQNMPLLFIPLFVGIISHWNLIKENLPMLVLNIILTTILTLIVTALFVENIIKFVRLKKMKDFHNG